MSLKCSLILYTHEFSREFAVLASVRKITVGSIVSCKGTRQLHHLESLNSSFR